MKFQVNHDLHIHSRLSPCNGDQRQTPENILRYGEENGFTTLCLTDHFWDETVPNVLTGKGYWYEKQDYAKITSWGALPQGKNTRFLFGCEIDMDRCNTIGLAPQHFDWFDFVIIPTNHLHLSEFTCIGDEDAPTRAKLWCDRLNFVLEQELPFEKIGLAHLTDTGIMSGTGYLDVLQMIPEETYTALFSKAAKRGCGIELNFKWRACDDAEMAIHLRPYRIARECGCKFYLGSDAHSVVRFEGMKENFQKIVDLLELEESDRFIPPAAR